MEFGWDPVKDEATRKARGFGFADVIELFDGRTVWEIVDSRFDYGEVRVKALGMVGSGLVTVVYNDRGDLRWIISARVASRRERRAWRAKFG